jgi:hypothetical protein
MLWGRPKGCPTESPFPPNLNELSRPFGVTLMTTRGLPPLILEKGKPTEKSGRKAKGREIPGSLVAERMTPSTTGRREGRCWKGLLFCHPPLGIPMSQSVSATSEEEALPFNGRGIPAMQSQAASPDMGT